MLSHKFSTLFVSFTTFVGPISIVTSTYQLSLTPHWNYFWYPSELKIDYFQILVTNISLAFSCMRWP